MASVYGLDSLSFGRDYLIPKPFDPRLIVELPLAVAKAAVESGVARRPITDYRAYRQRLSQRVIRSGFMMKPVFEKAISGAKRLVYTDGEEEPVLRAIRVVVDEGLARPILIGRPEVIDTRIERLGLKLQRGVDFELANPDNDPRYNDYVAHYLAKMNRKGVSPRAAREIVRTRRTAIGAIMLARGEADALIAGPVGAFDSHLRYILDVVGLDPSMREASTLHALVLDKGPLFIGDTNVSDHPDPEELAATTLAAAEVVKSFGIEPKVALVAASNFGSRDIPSARRMRQALALINAAAPDLAIDGEMHADSALSPVIRERILPESALIGPANLLIMPSLDAANIGYNLVKTLTGCVSVGPILIGPRQPAHIVTPSITTRGIVNLSALAGAQAIRGAE